MCPDISPGGRNREFRGWRTFFRHMDKQSVKDLCPLCDRTITTYFHVCSYGFVSDLTDEKALEVLTSLYKEIPHESSVWSEGVKLRSVEEDKGGNRLYLPQFSFLMSFKGRTVLEAVIDIVRDVPMSLPELHSRLVKGTMSIAKMRQLLKGTPELQLEESSGKWRTKELRKWREKT